MKIVKLSAAIYSIILLAGCASSGDQGAGALPDYQAELKASQLELDARNLELDNRNKEIQSLKQKLEVKPAVLSSSVDAPQQEMSSTSFSDSLLPPNAKAGQCFARVYTPPTYRTDSETVMKAEGYDVVSIIPAVYETEKKQVITQEATDVLEIIPAVYGWKQEQVLVSPEITELQRVPAEYGYEEQKLLVKTGSLYLEKGHRPHYQNK